MTRRSSRLRWSAGPILWITWNWTKIEDPALKNEVLDAIGTNNFRNKLAVAIQTEKKPEVPSQIASLT